MRFKDFLKEAQVVGQLPPFSGDDEMDSAARQKILVELEKTVKMAQKEFNKTWKQTTANRAPISKLVNSLNKIDSYTGESIEELVDDLDGKMLEVQQAFTDLLSEIYHQK